MDWLRRLAIAELLALSSLLLVACALGAFGAWDAQRNGSTDLFAEWSASRLLFYFTLILGAGPAALIGAPGYVWLHASGRAQWRYVLPIGLLPTLGFLWLSPELAPYAAGGGLAVASLTHLVGSRLRGAWSLAPPGAKSA